MDKGKWIITGMVLLALATSAGFIMGQQTGRSAPGEAPVAVEPPVAPAGAPSVPAPPPSPTTVSAVAAGELDAAAARRAAIRFLKGDPYGATDAAVDANIVGQRLDRNAGEDGHAAAWVFSVRVAPDAHNPDGITGDLSVDAKDGTIVSQGLPYLD